MSSHADDRTIALVTGANKGIGLEIARQLGRLGMTVLVGARNQGRGQEAACTLRSDGVDALYVRIDVTDQASIDAAAQWIRGAYGRLDVLVNNTGIQIDDQPPSLLKAETLRRTYDTNFFGPVAVTQAMLPLLRQSRAGRVVNLSSVLGSLTAMTDPRSEFYERNLLGYNASKAALNMATVAFAKELRATGIKVNSADPGYTATDLNGHRGTRSVQQAARAAVRLATLPDDGPSGGFFDDEGRVPW